MKGGKVGNVRQVLPRNSPRTLRAQLQRGDLPGVKRQGRWRIDRRVLRLNEAQRRRLQEKADSIRQAVEDVLPSRLASSAGQRGRSVADLDAFRRGGEVLHAIRAADGQVLAEASRDRVVEQLEEALLALAEAAQQFDRAAKLEAIGRSRRGIARAAALLLLDAGIPAAVPGGGPLRSRKTATVRQRMPSVLVGPDPRSERPDVRS